MNKINILILAPVGEKNLRRISGLSPRLNVTDASEMVIQPAFQVTRKEGTPDARLEVLLDGAEIMFGLRFIPDLVKRAPHLRWVQTMSAGVESILSPDMVNSQIALTNVSGIHTIQINELVFSLIMAFAKQIPHCLENQKQKKWERFAPVILQGKTLGVVGLGNIGTGIARTAKHLGMRVLATRRSIKEAARTRYVDTVYPASQLDRLLKESDFVVLALPHTASTDKIIGEKEFALMKPSAFLVNIGRGKTVDEEALVRALKEKRIAGAGLDTFAVEPLPPGSPLWEMPGVIITPHIAGSAGDYMLKATDIFCENLQRYLSGRRLINVVNKKQGY
jgi:phosphoglycerate dehydrogenase-like enzyme